MLAPNRVRYRKVQRRRMKGAAHKNNRVKFGNMGLMATEPKEITANQIEACRVSMTRVVRKYGRSWTRIFPDRPFTKKPAETRQGKGKGNPEGYVARVKPGQILFEVQAEGFPEVERKALIRAMHKLPGRYKVVEKFDY